MENAVVVREVLVAEQAEAEPLEQAQPEPFGWVIRRLKHKVLTEEALKRTESFAAERKKPFIAAIRKSRSEPYVSDHVTNYTAKRRGRHETSTSRG